MRVEFIQGIDEIRKLRANWDAVWEADPESQFFLSFPWLFGGKAPLGHNAFVLAAKPERADADFVAFLPLRIRTLERPNAGFHNEASCAGNYASDYTGFICRAGFEEEAIPALSAKVRQLHWMQLRLEYFRASEHRSELFLRGFAKSTFEITETNLVNSDGINNGICPFVDLPDSWDKYLESSVSSNTRQKIRRFLRQIETSEDYRITHADPATLTEDVEGLLALWQTKWGPRKAKRLAAIMQTNRSMLYHAAAIGALFLPVLRHKGRIICALAIFVDPVRKTYNFYIAGRDEAFKGPPTGLVLHGYAIRHAIAQGMVRYDFLRGNEPYKYSFGCDEVVIKSLILSTRDNQNLGHKLHPPSVARVLQRSIDHHQKGRLDQAERGYRQVLETDPRHGKTLYMLGQLAASRGDHATAVKHFRAAVTQSPDVAKAWHRLGRSLQARETWAEAAEAYAEAIRRRRTEPKVWCELGGLLLRLDLPELASATFENVLQMNKDDATARSGRDQAQATLARWSPEEAARRGKRHAALGKRIAGMLALAPQIPAPATAAPPPPAISPAIERSLAAASLIANQPWRPAQSAVSTVLTASGPARPIKPLIRTPQSR